MRSNRIVCLISSLIFATPLAAETEGFHLGASYLNSNSEYSGYSDHGSGYELNFGYGLNKHLAFEVSYSDFGSLHLPKIPDAGGTIESDGISIQMVAKYPVDKFTFYGKLGNLWWDREGVLGSVAGPVKFNSDGSDLMYGVGASYNITSHLDVNIEFKGSNADHDSSVSTVGISYHF